MVEMRVGEYVRLIFEMLLEFSIPQSRSESVDFL